MVETTMKTEIFVKKLQARRRQIKAGRAKELKKYNIAFLKWKLALARWIVETSIPRVRKLTRAEAEGRGYGRGYQATILDGAPELPRFPSDEPLKRIARLLRQLSVTEQKTVQLRSSDIEEIFGDDVEDD